MSLSFRPLSCTPLTSTRGLVDMCVLLLYHALDSSMQSENLTGRCVSFSNLDGGVLRCLPKGSVSCSFSDPFCVERRLLTVPDIFVDLGSLLGTRGEPKCDVLSTQ